jgi:N-acetylmuramoyl-L-alanine amidase
MTRTTDKYVDYEDRYDLANEKNADLFISVHLNSVTNTSVDGTTAIYPNNHDISVSNDAADFIHQRVTNVLDEYTDPYKDNRNLSVLRNTDVPAVITETGFISNSSDLKFLKSSDGQEEIAYEIYRGIKNWWND